MTTAQDYLDQIAAASVFERIAELQRRPDSTFTAIIRSPLEQMIPGLCMDNYGTHLDIQYAFEHHPHRQYDDGEEVWLGWSMHDTMRLKPNHRYAGYFGLFFPEKDELWVYRTQGIMPTPERDLARDPLFRPGP